jgi:hypothetical protein
MHPQLSPVVAQMRLDELNSRRQIRLVGLRRARPQRSFGRRRPSTRSPAATAPVADLAPLPDSRACSEAVRGEHVREQCVA